EKAEAEGDLLAHYAAPIIAGDDLYLEVKSGQYISCSPPGSGRLGASSNCGPNAWGSQTWNVKRFHWENGSLVEKWTFASSWKPVPAGLASGWEPVFQPVVSGPYVYVPGLGGSVDKLDGQEGKVLNRVD